MSYNHPRQTNPYPQGNVQGGQPQDSGYNNQRTSRSHSLQSSVHTGGNPTSNRSLSANRAPVSGQAQSFDAYGTGQNREPGLPYVPSTNTPQYISGQGQIQSPSYQDPSHVYHQSAEQYFPTEGSTPHLVPQQSRTHQPSPQPPSMSHNPSHSVQGQYSQYQRGDVEYPAGQQPVQQRRSSSSQYPQRQQQPQQPPPPPPSTQLYPQQPQSSPPQYQQHQQPSTQHYSQPQRSSPPQPQRQYQPPSQQYTQGQQPPPLGQQGNFATGPGNATSSFGANVPSEHYGTPREETRQSRTTQRGTTHTGPVCRRANCRNPAIRDGATHELTEYCSLDHMQEDARRGARLCPACNKCPRRINGRFCGTSCEKYDREQPRQSHQQQQHYPRPPAGVRPHLSTPSPSGNVNWGNPGESSSVSNFSPVGGLVLCPNPKCNTTYSARGRSHPRPAGYGGQGGPVDSLPPCPMCGFSQRT